MPADGSTFPPPYRCRACKTITRLCDLDDAMRCEACAEPVDDEPMSGLQDSIVRANEHRLRFEA